MKRRKRSAIRRLTLFGLLGVGGGVTAAGLFLVMLLAGFVGAGSSNQASSGNAHWSAPCLFPDYQLDNWFGVAQSWYRVGSRPHPSLLWPEDAFVQTPPNIARGWQAGYPESGHLRYREHPLMCRMSPPFAEDATWFGAFLHCDAWAGLQGLRTAFYEQFGVPLGIGNGYRTRAQQGAMVSNPLAATPGQSWHGWGIAVDFTGPAAVFGIEHDWMRANAGRFGWFHPTWAHADGSRPEPWHWEWVSAEELGIDCLPNPGGHGDTPELNRVLGQAIAAEQGWVGDEWECLLELWMRESGWDHEAINRTPGGCDCASGCGNARGIPQAVNTCHPETATDAWLASPDSQIRWGLNYIRNRHQTPCGAWAHFQDRGWY
ncbi:MAG: M15 family metallopeptidase [Promicromonosporaceae bacterium]|nr:M15 family metallopeptidase [Promicromonosporaceae bacterium]